MQLYKFIDLFIKRISNNRVYFFCEAPTENHKIGQLLNLNESLRPLQQQYPEQQLFFSEVEQRISYGKALYQILADNNFWNLIKTTISENEKKQLQTRLRIRYQSTDNFLAQIRWELLHDDSQFLTNYSHLHISRLPFDIPEIKFPPMKTALQGGFFINDSQLTAAPSEEDPVAAYLYALFPFLRQRTLEMAVFANPTSKEISHFVKQSPAQVLWLANPNFCQENDNDTECNPAELIEALAGAGSIRLILLGGMNLPRRATDTGIFEQVHTLARKLATNVILLPAYIPPLFIHHFFQAILAQEPLDGALKQATQLTVQVASEADFNSVAHFVDIEALMGSRQPDDSIQSFCSDNDLRVWEQAHKPALSVIRTRELLQISQELFEPPKIAALVYGAHGVGKTEFINQLIIKLSPRFHFVQKFNPDDYLFPHKIISRLAQALNKTEFYTADLDSIHLNEPGKQMEWLIEALNQTPLLLIFEDIDSPRHSFGANQQKESFSNLIRTMLFGIRNNTRLLFSANTQVFEELASQMVVLNLGAFQLEQTATLLLTAENKSDSLFDPTREFINLTTGENDPQLFTFFLKIQHQFAWQPTLLKLIRYLIDLMPSAEWREKLETMSPAELQTPLFQKFEELLSKDVEALILTCCLLPAPFEIDLLYFIYKRKSSNYKIISNYLDELTYSGLITREYLKIDESAEIEGYCLQVDFKKYLQERFSEELAEARLEVLNTVGEYFELKSKIENQLWDWLMARSYYVQAQNNEKAELITQKILNTLIETNHQTLAMRILEYWLDSNEMPTSHSIITIIRHLTTVEEQQTIDTRVLAKIEKWADNLPEPLDRGKVLQQLGQFHYNRHEFADSIRNFNKSLAIFAELAASEEMTSIYKDLANIYYKLKDYQKAKQLYEKSLPQDRENYDAMVLYKLGNIAYLEKDLESALNYYVEGLALAIESDKQILSAKILHQLGMLHTDQRNYIEAIKKFKECIKLHHVHNNMAAYADTLHELANVQFLCGDYQAALENYEKSFMISAEQGDAEDTAISLHQIGMTYHALGEQKRAIEKLNESLEIAKNLDDDAALLDTSYQLASIYLSLGDDHKALAKFQNCLGIAQKNQDQAGQSDCLHEIGYIYYLRGNHLEARAKFEESLKIADQLHDYHRIAGTLHELSQLYEEMGEKKKAKKYRKQAAELFKKINQDETLLPELTL